MIDLFDILKAKAGIPVDDIVAVMLAKKQSQQQKCYLLDINGTHLIDAGSAQLIVEEDIA
jgi:hypothetical protein